jgi:hypothetical protein
MKSFKEHINEGFFSKGAPQYQQVWNDQDAMPSAPDAIEALNSFVGQIGEHEVMNPRTAVARIKENISKLGYEFEMFDIDKEGTTSFPLKYGSGAFGTSYDENPYGEFKEDDGISNHIEGGISLMITVTPTGTGKSIVNAEVVRNMDSME